MYNFLGATTIETQTTNFTIQVDQWHAKNCEEIAGGFGLAHERNLKTTKRELRKLVCDV